MEAGRAFPRVKPEVGIGDWLVGQIRRLDVLPKVPSLGPVTYSRGLVSYVAGLGLASIGVGALWVRAPADWLTLGVAMAIGFFMSYYSIRGLTSKEASWSPNIFVSIGTSVILGPAGALGMAITQAVGIGLESRNGWFRSLFNVCMHFLSNLTVWGVFWGVERLAPQDPWVGILAGITAGLGGYLVNNLLLTLVMKSGGAPEAFWVLISKCLKVLPFSLGYGIPAFGFLFLYDHYHLPGFLVLLAPVIVLHGFLIQFKIKVEAHREETERYQAVELILKQDKLDASENERKRIARDLHDGVVQELVGMAYMLKAKASEYKNQPEAKELLEMLEESVAVTQGAAKDLRTLIVELAPPTLRKEGLTTALREPLQEMEMVGIKTSLIVPEELNLTEDRKEMVFVVAREALGNIKKHAGAKNVAVEITLEGDDALLCIRDDGKGFTAREAEVKRSEGHHGVVGMRERVELAGGQFQIDSELGKGTEVKLRLPLRQAA